MALQLSSWSVQVCLSIGYLVRSMLQATVVVILEESTHLSQVTELILVLQTFSSNGKTGS